MGEASRRKGLVEEARKKIGEEAASVVAQLESRVNQLQLQHRTFVFEIEALRKACQIATGAPAELRRDVRAFQGDLAMKAEQLEAVSMRVQSAIELVTALAQTNSVDEQLAALRHNAAVDHRRVRRLETLTWWPRLRWVLTGRLPAWIDLEA